MNPNDHIRDYLKYYLDLPTSPRYAVMLSGTWGSGKTWFINNFWERHPEYKDRVLHVSLYGISSLEAIESEIFAQKHPTLTKIKNHKATKVLGWLLKSALKISVNIDANHDQKPDGSVTASMPSDQIGLDISVSDSSILVFDDLERSAIPIADVLGYINQYVELAGIKTIVLANEFELFPKQSSNQGIDTSLDILPATKNYQKTKEKLIGRTFQIKPELDTAIDRFIRDTPDGFAKNFLKSNINLINDIYSASKTNNLRIVRQALFDYCRLIDAIDPKFTSSSALLTDLLKLYLANAIEIYSGNLDSKELIQLYDSITFYFQSKQKGEDPAIKRLGDIKEKYKVLHLYENLVPARAWTDIFSTGNFPSAELNQSIASSRHFMNDDRPDWINLWHWRDLSDEDFEKTLKSVAANWEAGNYVELGVVLHVAGMLIKYSENELYDKPVAEITKTAENAIGRIVENVTTIDESLSVFSSHLGNSSYAGLGYHSKDHPDFKEIFNNVIQRLKKAKTNSYPEAAAKLIEIMISDPSLFYDMLTLSNNGNSRYHKIPILAYASEKSFVDQLVSAPPKSWEFIYQMLDDRYRFPEFAGYLATELPWLIELRKLLVVEMEDRGRRISGMKLKILVEEAIDKAISTLQDRTKTTEQ